jgi:ribosome modulation factor
MNNLIRMQQVRAVVKPAPKKPKEYSPRHETEHQQKQRRMAFARAAGIEAFLNCQSDEDNPYGKINLMERSAWLSGWLDAKRGML